MKTCLVLAATFAALSISSPALAIIIPPFDPPPSITVTTLVDLTNLPNQSDVTTFTALGATTLFFSGYNDTLSNFSLLLNGTGPNLLSGLSLSTPVGELNPSFVGSDGSFHFTGSAFNDTFGTNPLAAGSYTLNYTLTGNGGPNGLRITGTNVTNPNTVPAAVPEPATWAMMLLGFGGIGFSMRRNRKGNGALMQIA